MQSIKTQKDPEMMWHMTEFEKWAEFLVEWGRFLTVPPFNGRLQKIVLAYELYVKQESQRKNLSQTDFEGFLAKFDDFLGQFNDLSGDSMLIVEENMTGNKLQNQRLEYINMSKLFLLLDKIGGKDKRLELKVENGHSDFEINNENPGQTLLAMLQQKNHTEVSATVRADAGVPTLEFHFGFSDLNKLLNKPSAAIILGKQRAKIGTLKKPFFDICNDTTHAKVLSKVCLSRKDIVSVNTNAKQSYFSSLDQCYQLIESNRKLFPKEIYQCCFKRIHHLPIINSNTDESLGDCSYLDTCHKMKSCRYLHYFTLTPLIKGKKYRLDQEIELRAIKENLYKQGYTNGFSNTEFFRDILPPQWINCDVRYLPFLILGKFAVILSDPAWDIHMSLPYGTCTDEELMSLPMHELQDEGIMLLWVTGRSIEIGRKAFAKWGYKISDELIWLKLNQLKRTIVTGRTGHWLNHSKEHLLVGLKGNPPWINRMIDINTVVSGTRETLRKPDEVYDLVERIVGVHSRKLEIFGRDHNVRPGWLTIGNQLTGTSIHEKDVLKKYEKFKANEPKDPRQKKPQTLKPNQKLR